MISDSDIGLERSIYLDLSQAEAVCRPDQRDWQSPMPLSRFGHPLKTPDYYIWLQDKVLLLEVKDIDDPNVPEGERRGFLKKLQSHELTEEHLLPKLYGACVHLIQEDIRLDCDVHFACLIAYTELTYADRLMLMAKVQRIVNSVGPRLGSSPIVFEAHNIESWNKSCPELPVTRIS